MTAAERLAAGDAPDLHNLLKQGADLKSIQRQVFDWNVKRTAASDPELALMLRACAIPRRFDAQVIGVLRDKPGELEANARLLAGLLNFAFVLPRRDGGYVYHDNTRDLVLEDWFENPAAAQEFDQLNRRLVAFYERQHDDAQQAEQDLAQVAQVVIAANPARYAQLTAIVEKRIVAPLLEALYHAALRSPQIGYDLFARYALVYERKGRLAVCELTLNSVRDTLERLPPIRGQAPWLQWLRYWEARIAWNRANYAEAERLLTLLRAEAADDIMLHSWVLAGLGPVLTNQIKLREAREVYHAALALAKDTRVDLYNLPVAYDDLGNFHAAVGELEQAAGVFREGLQMSQAEPDTRLDTPVLMRLDLSNVLAESGQWAPAFDTALEALRLGRDQLSNDPAVQQRLATQFMSLFARRDPQLLDTLFAECEPLPVSAGDSPQFWMPRRQYSELLQESGQLERSATQLSDLLRRAQGHSDTFLGTALLFTQAGLRWQQGQFTQAVDLYAAIVQRAGDGRATIWDGAAALSNLGTIRSETQAAWQATALDLEQASRQWTEIGNAKFAARMQVQMATAARRQGNPAHAQQLLDEVAGVFTGTVSSQAADYYLAQGDTYRDQALYPQARAAYEQALKINQSLDKHRLVARNLGELVELAVLQGQWAEAERHTRAAGDSLSKLVEAQRYAPTAAVQRADEMNALGLQHIYQTKDRLAGLRAARDRFLAASELVPENIWYSLNLSWAQASLEQWAEAAQTLELALEKAPAWLRSPVLYAAVAEYRVKQAERLTGGPDRDDEARAVAASLTRLNGRAAAGWLAQGWRALGDAWLRLRRIQDAHSAYEAGLESASSADAGARTIDDTRLAELHARLGFIDLELAESPSARQRFAEALRHYHAGDHPEAGAALGTVCQSLIQNVDQYWRLDAGWEALVASFGLDEPARVDMLAARDSLAKSLDHLYKINDPGALSIPSVLPISVDVSVSLIPKVDSSQDGGKFLYQDIPALRRRIEAELGLQIPGVRIRDDSALPPGGYVIRLDEITVALGAVPDGLGYCPASLSTLQSLGLASVASIPGVHPRTGGAGFWIPRDQWDQVTQRGLEVWTETGYILVHLEAVLRRNLANFLTTPYVKVLTDRWAKNELGASLLKAALPDHRSRVGLAWLLRELVREWVPITSWSEILSVVSEHGLRPAQFETTLQAVRLRLKPQLPGNQTGARRLELPPELEQTISLGRKTANDLPSIDPQPHGDDPLMASLRKWLLAAPAEAVLVTRSSDARLLVRRLIEAEFPDLMVLARAELLAQDERAAEAGLAGEPPLAAVNANAL